MFTYRHIFTMNNKNAVTNLWRRKSKSCTCLAQKAPIVSLVSRRIQRCLSIFYKAFYHLYIEGKHMVYVVVDNNNDIGKLKKTRGNKVKHIRFNIIGGVFRLLKTELLQGYLI